MPPDRDSDVVTFLLRPLFPGELVVKLKVFARDGRNVMRLLRIFSEASDRAIEGGRVVVSIPLATAAAEERQREPGFFTRMFGAAAPSDAQPALPAPSTPPAAPSGPGEYTRMFGTAAPVPPQPTPAASSARRRRFRLRVRR